VCDAQQKEAEVRRHKIKPSMKLNKKLKTEIIQHTVRAKKFPY
jgi:hypothetical protein